MPALPVPPKTPRPPTAAEQAHARAAQDAVVRLRSWTVLAPWLAPVVARLGLDAPLAGVVAADTADALLRVFLNKCQHGPVCAAPLALRAGASAAPAEVVAATAARSASVLASASAAGMWLWHACALTDAAARACAGAAAAPGPDGEAPWLAEAATAVGLGVRLPSATCATTPWAAAGAAPCVQAVRLWLRAAAWMRAAAMALATAAPAPRPAAAVRAARWLLHAETVLVHASCAALLVDETADRLRATAARAWLAVADVWTLAAAKTTAPPVEASDFCRLHAAECLLLAQRLAHVRGGRGADDAATADMALLRLRALRAAHPGEE
jgi:hypothetical protein